MIYLNVQRLMDSNGVSRDKFGKYLSFRTMSWYYPRISGVCFESGGYNLKCGATSEVELMKYDMGGMGAALGAALAIGHLKPTGGDLSHA